VATSGARQREFVFRASAERRPLEILKTPVGGFVASASTLESSAFLVAALSISRGSGKKSRQTV